MDRYGPESTLGTQEWDEHEEAIRQEREKAKKEEAEKLRKEQERREEEMKRARKMLEERNREKKEKDDRINELRKNLSEHGLTRDDRFYNGETRERWISNLNPQGWFINKEQDYDLVLDQHKRLLEEKRQQEENARRAKQRQSEERERRSRLTPAQRKAEDIERAKQRLKNIIKNNQYITSKQIDLEIKYAIKQGVPETDPIIQKARTIKEGKERNEKSQEERRRRERETAAAEKEAEREAQQLRQRLHNTSYTEGDYVPPGLEIRTTGIGPFKQKTFWYPEYAQELEEAAAQYREIGDLSGY